MFLSGWYVAEQNAWLSSTILGYAAVPQDCGPHVRYILYMVCIAKNSVPHCTESRCNAIESSTVNMNSLVVPYINCLDYETQAQEWEKRQHT
jgi:hypothetical protein